jgi:hypothetical protein
MADQSETQGVPHLCREPQSKILAGGQHVAANHHLQFRTPFATLQHELLDWDGSTKVSSQMLVIEISPRFSLTGTVCVCPS